jgi:hypothetical protein
MVVTGIDNRNISMLMDQVHAAIVCEVLKTVSQDYRLLIAASESPNLRELLPFSTADDVLAAVLEFTSVTGYHLNIVREAIKILANQRTQQALESNKPAGTVQ